MSHVVYDSSEPRDGYIERKSVDTSGRLGSLYDAFTDNIINPQAVQASDIKPLLEPYICRIFSGDQSSAIIDYFEWMDFNAAMRQSILFGLVTPSGISSLIDYNRSISVNTRFLYYSYRSKEEELSLTCEKANEIISSLSSSTRATHMITEILWGFEILCVIPISDDQFSNTVASLLQNIANGLKSSGKDFILTDDETLLIAQLTNVTVYGSVTCIDNPNIPLLTVLSMLKDWQNDDNFHHPLKYTMCSLRLLCNNSQFSELSDLPDQTNFDIAKIQPTIIWLDNWSKTFQRRCQALSENFSSPTLNQALKDIQKHLDTWLSTYRDFRKHLQKVLVDIRQRCYGSIVIQDVMSDERYSLMKDTEIHALNETIQQFLTKAMLIKRLNEEQIQYINVMDLRHHGKIPMTYEHIEKALRRLLSKEDSCVCILYSNDRLKHEKAAEWEEVYQQFLLKRQETVPRTILAYADFAQCQYHLEHFTLANVLMRPSETPRNHPTDSPISSTYSPPLPRSPKQPPPPSITEINVLLLGETGVGKSTFINAFVNYLISDTLPQAEQSEPVVLIPVSFLITTSDQFDEFIVKFGDVDANEDHGHQGQSVTQQCKSYVFHLNDRLILRLIDTPGIGGTRGVVQDDKTMDHILTYVNNLSHLNAVCFFLKPNTSQLNVFFRSCVNQSFTYLTPAGYNNIIFCFTNARATFFAPGDTGTLLRQMLKKEHQDDIPFQKTNTFCFDSEAFRYLAARKCGVEFDDFQKQECINSWTTSVTESIRLLNYILARDSYYLDEWQSPRKVTLEISMLARPLMETLRLILYNWQLSEFRLVDKEMILDSNPVMVEICSNCAKHDIVKVGSFWIDEFEPVKNNTDSHCQCHFDERQFLIESTVKHDFVSQQIDSSGKELEECFYNFLFKCDTLSHYLQQKQGSNQDDPFELVLERFLEDEQRISEIMKNNLNMNKNIREILLSVKTIRQQNKQKLIKSNEQLSLKDVYKIIDKMKSIPDVSKQIKSIKTSRQLKMKANEYRVKLPPIENKRFSDLINSFC